MQRHNRRVSYLDFPGSAGHVRYAEGLYVGYRWYDARDIPVDHPFGHGLSYTRFAYSDARVETYDMDHELAFTASVSVTNIGERAGAGVFDRRQPRWGCSGGRRAGSPARRAARGH